LGLDFRIWDFAYPLAMVRTKRQFERNQYLSSDELAAYQWQRLQRVLSHAYAKVPYYRRIFQANGLHPAELRGLADTSRLPFLSKRILAQSFAALTADDVRAYRPMELRTSGTTGEPVRFLVDRAANVLEFVYYWRLWGWHGYRLGTRFAELSAESFLPIEANRGQYGRYERFVGRLLVNSLLLSRANAREYVALLRRYRPRFLKGLPSNLYVLALLCDGIANHGITFRAMFAQGENLLAHQRQLVERVFAAPVYDCYGHLERTAAISQCPHGSYHVHSDYGLVELVAPEREPELAYPLGPGQTVLEVVGTSLHNLSMPLIRYRTGDLVIVNARRGACPCHRSFPVVDAIVGRSTDIVVTADGRAITALYVALDRVPGVACAQIVQESPETLLVHVVPDDEDPAELRDLVVRAIHAFTGPSMRVLVHMCRVDDIHASDGRKRKSIVSHLDPLVFIR
jgi:phenylacetate-CoA ligase